MLTKGNLILKQFVRMANLNDMLIKSRSREILVGYGNSDLNCIDCVGRLKRPNTTIISDDMKMTRGAISKIVRKLQDKGAIGAYQLPDNQKEVYFKLTPYGRQIYQQHRLRHMRWEKQDMDFFSTLDDETLDTVLRFMNLYNGHLEMKLADEFAETQSETTSGEIK